MACEYPHKAGSRINHEEVVMHQVATAYKAGPGLIHLFIRPRDIQGHTVAARAAGFGGNLRPGFALSGAGNKINLADYPFQGGGVASGAMEFDLFVGAGKTPFKKLTALQAAKFIDGHDNIFPSLNRNTPYFIVTVVVFYVNNRPFPAIPVYFTPHWLVSMV